MILERDFYNRSSLEVAKDLLGMILVHDTDQGVTKGKIVEVEAYMGTKIRLPILYGKQRKNRGYVWGMDMPMHIWFMACITVWMLWRIIGTRRSLIRALEPLSGVDLMTKEER